MTDLQKVVDKTIEKANAETKGWETVEKCRLCGSADVIRLVPAWAETQGGIPIIGCGNPWHYVIPAAND